MVLIFNLEMPNSSLDISVIYKIMLWLDYRLTYNFFFNY